MSEAPKRIWAWDVDGTGSVHMCSKGDEGAVEYVRADLLPVVKPLVWEETHNGVWCARYRAGHFYECLNMGADRWVVYETIHGTSRQIDTWSDLEAALTAAQADYEARIRASLDMIDPAALVAGAYEAAAMEFDGWDNVPVQMTYDEARCRIRDLTPANAQDALDAAIAKAVNAKLDEVAAYCERHAMAVVTQPSKAEFCGSYVAVRTYGYGEARHAGMAYAAAILAMKEPE